MQQQSLYQLCQFKFNAGRLGITIITLLITSSSPTNYLGLLKKMYIHCAIGQNPSLHSFNDADAQWKVFWIVLHQLCQGERIVFRDGRERQLLRKNPIFSALPWSQSPWAISYYSYNYYNYRSLWTFRLEVGCPISSFKTGIEWGMWPGRGPKHHSRSSNFEVSTIILSLCFL